MFIPHTFEETISMLKTIGFEHIDELFSDIPAPLRNTNLDLPEALTEMEISKYLDEISQANETTQDLMCFLGAGYYNHYSPAIVDSMLRLGSFYSAYTPYQPEISQGTLQVIYEYQSLICALTGMEASNASHYDGATAAAEAVLTAFYQFNKKRSKVILSHFINPQYSEVIDTYASDLPQVNIIHHSAEDADIPSLIDNDTALIVLQYPDFMGNIKDYSTIVNTAHEHGALICVIVNPIALGMLTPPGEWGADIVVGEGQPLGIPLWFGGPGLGFFATSKKMIRKIAGRISGETTDANGNRGYVLTLTAREQHIRREKATSNICTNQALLALAATVYLSALGKHGLQQVASTCYQNAHYAAKEIQAIAGYTLINTEAFFHEFVISCPVPVSEINEHLLDHGILSGLDVSRIYPEYENPVLFALTELNDREQIDTLVEVLKEFSHA
jgi:glycine dehydrogenase subunit 1